MTIAILLATFSSLLMGSRFTYAQAYIFGEEYFHNGVIQPADSDSVPRWSTNFTGSLNGNEAAYSNWSDGGVNSLALTASTVFNSKYVSHRFGYNVDVNLKYGQTKLQGFGLRKTDDLIRLKNQMNLFFNDRRFSGFVSVSFKSQFDKGFEYPNDSTEVLISRFLAPAYLKEGTGIAFQPVDYFSIQGGFALQQTIVRDTTLSTRYGLKRHSTLLTEGGIGIGIDFNKEVFKNVTFHSSIETFTSFVKPIRSTDVSFANEITGKVNSFMNVNLQFEMLYNDDITKAIQIKQVLALGVNIQIL